MAYDFLSLILEHPVIKSGFRVFLTFLFAILGNYILQSFIIKTIKLKINNKNIN